ncbi:hypothetical protein [Gemella morbillorum]
MKDEFLLNVIVGFVLGALLTGILFTIEIENMQKENLELKIQNHKLERQLLELYTEQAEHTKRTAERNGVGG